MAFTKKNEEAVSPVIGVILMVAITVILAAVIAAFVFGMAGNVGKTKVVAITAQRPSETNISVTNMGGPDVLTLTQLNVSVDGTASTSGLTKDTGSTVNIITSSGKRHVIVTGTFADASQQVLLDTYV
jgi:flagellin-like protein